MPINCYFLYLVVNLFREETLTYAPAVIKEAGIKQAMINEFLIKCIRVCVLYGILQQFLRTQTQ